MFSTVPHVVIHYGFHSFLCSAVQCFCNAGPIWIHKRCFLSKSFIQCKRSTNQRVHIAMNIRRTQRRVTFCPSFSVSFSRLDILTVQFVLAASSNFYPGSFPTEDWGAWTPGTGCPPSRALPFWTHPLQRCYFHLTVWLHCDSDLQGRSQATHPTRHLEQEIGLAQVLPMFHSEFKEIFYHAGFCPVPFEGAWHADTSLWPFWSPSLLNPAN